jgi:hypothetical protein
LNQVTLGANLSTMSDDMPLKLPRYVFRSPIHRNIRVTRVDDLIRVVTLNAAVMASGSLTYLMSCVRA